jgi:outer membrane protein TolC
MHFFQYIGAKISSNNARPRRAVTILLMALITGCSTTQYRESADREAYAILRDKAPLVQGTVEDFDIGPVLPPELEILPILDPGPSLDDDGNPLLDEDGNEIDALLFLGESSAVERGSHILTLEDALKIAFSYSRTYKTQKEQLYGAALRLTLERDQYAPFFSGTASADYSRSTTDIVRDNAIGDQINRPPNWDNALSQLTGTPQTLFQEYSQVVAAAAALSGADTTSIEIMNERAVSGRTSVGVNLLMKSGARLGLNLTSNFLRFLTGDSRESAISAITGSLVQPLLPGATKRINAENLTQAERDMLYALRQFTRFRKQFAVLITTEYYGVLQSRFAADISYRSLQTTKRSLDRLQAFADVDQGTSADVRRFTSSVLNGESAWIGSITTYSNQLDRFKISLGLSTDALLVLDDGELERLREEGLRHPTGITVEEATEVAFVTRLDIQTTADQLEDADRRLYIAARNLLPDLDLVASATVNTQPGSNQPLDFDWQRIRWNVGLDVDLGLERKSERNSFVNSQIAFQRASRDLDLARDNLKFDVRNRWRRLEQDRRNYKIQNANLENSVADVEEQLLRQDIGQGNPINLEDAIISRSGAENNVINALVSHTTTRLNFWADLGILYIKEDGQWTTPGHNYEESVQTAKQQTVPTEFSDTERPF